MTSNLLDNRSFSAAGRQVWNSLFSTLQQPDRLWTVQTTTEDILFVRDHGTLLPFCFLMHHE